MASIPPTITDPISLRPPALTTPGIRKNGLSSPHKISFQPLFSNISSYAKTPGKQWHPRKSAFRLQTGQNSFAQRLEKQKAVAATKAKEREMKAEKEAERQVRVFLLPWRIFFFFCSLL